MQKHTVQISHGSVVATIDQIGARLASLSVHGRDFLEAFGGQYNAGDLLIPFPNRIAGGKYSFDHVAHQLPLNEPARGNAIHGFTRVRAWSSVKHDPHLLTLAIQLDGSDQGYPFELSTAVTYEVISGAARDVLLVTTKTQNVGKNRCPYGLGAHPYLRLPGEPIDECLLAIPATSYFMVDQEMIPIVPAIPVAGTLYDFRKGRVIQGISLDTCFTGLKAEGDGFIHVKLTPRTGSPTVTVFMDEKYPYLQVFTADTLPPGNRRRALAVEPQSCAPNAFNNQEGLVILNPGERHVCQWGISITR